MYYGYFLGLPRFLVWFGLVCCCCFAFVLVWFWGFAIVWYFETESGSVAQAGHNPASASQVLALQVCTTTRSFPYLFLCVIFLKL
jgi:hypothetical protein